LFVDASNYIGRVISSFSLEYCLILWRTNHYINWLPESRSGIWM